MNIKSFQNPKNGRFLPGMHWRTPQPFRKKEWLMNEYIIKNRSTGDIAKEFNVTNCAILFWMKKYNIKRRSISESRKIKYWGSKGDKNWMFGKKGSNAPSYKGGCTPERQSFYESKEWKDVVSLVWKRDNYTCQKCKTSKHGMHIHHIVSFRIKHLRAVLSNLILLCPDCHNFVHSRKNINKEFIKEYYDN